MAKTDLVASKKAALEDMRYLMAMDMDRASEIELATDCMEHHLLLRERPHDCCNCSAEDAQQGLTIMFRSGRLTFTQECHAPSDCATDPRPDLTMWILSLDEHSLSLLLSNTSSSKVPTRSTADLYAAKDNLQRSSASLEGWCGRALLRVSVLSRTDASKIC